MMKNVFLERSQVFEKGSQYWGWSSPYWVVGSLVILGGVRVHWWGSLVYWMEVPLVGSLMCWVGGINCKKECGLWIHSHTHTHIHTHTPWKQNLRKRKKGDWKVVPLRVSAHHCLAGNTYLVCFPCFFGCYYCVFVCLRCVWEWLYMCVSFVHSHFTLNLRPSLTVIDLLMTWRRS